MTAAAMIRAAMEGCMLTQKELAGQLSIGQSYMSDILLGRRAISAHMAIQFERVFGADIISAERLLITQVREQLAKAREYYQ